jgi:hypothetical protein
VDAVSSVSQPLCQLFNLNNCSAQGAPFDSGALCVGGEYGLSWATHAYNTNRQSALTNYCLGLRPRRFSTG